MFLRLNRAAEITGTEQGRHGKQKHQEQTLPFFDGSSSWSRNNGLAAFLIEFAVQNLSKVVLRASQQAISPDSMVDYRIDSGMMMILKKKHAAFAIHGRAITAVLCCFSWLISGKRWHSPRSKETLPITLEEVSVASLINKEQASC